MLLPLTCGGFLFALFLRLWYFQVVENGVLVEKASLSGKLYVNELAPRGLIYDRDGRLLAGVKPEVVVTAIPSLLRRPGRPADRLFAAMNRSVAGGSLGSYPGRGHAPVLERVAAILGVPVEALESKLKRALGPRLPAPIFVGATVEQAAQITEDSADLPGIGVETQPMRFYSDTVDFSHVLGYAWVPDENDLKRLASDGVKPEPYVGKVGLERFYDRQLIGMPGTEEVEIDAKRRPVRVVGRDNAIPGSRMILTLSTTLQKLAQDSLQGRIGAAVALDPATGEILCMVSSPTFDVSKFARGISSADYEDLKSNDKLMNRATSGLYAPGSTFKIVTSLAMEESGILDTGRRVFCDGAYHVTKKARIACEGHHGWIGYTQALEKSCNTYFCTLGRQAGPEALAHAAEEFGLGERPDIDIRSDVQAGIVPDAEYKRSHKMGHWYGGDTANMAIGQGSLQVSPLQMADLAAMVANRGVMYKPHLVHAIRPPGTKDGGEIAPEVLRKIDVAPAFWDVLINALRGVIESGTGTEARIPDLDWAGKTGSSEHTIRALRKQIKTHSWFIGFAPADHPRIAIAVLVESGGQGGLVAAPIARKLVQAYLFPPKASVVDSSTLPNSVDALSASDASTTRP